jgi:hypothetical protein
VARPVLEFYGKLAAFESGARLRRRGHADAAAGHLGLAHLPPIKVVTFWPLAQVNFSS